MKSLFNSHISLLAACLSTLLWSQSVVAQDNLVEADTVAESCSVDFEVYSDSVLRAKTDSLLRAETDSLLTIISVERLYYALLIDVGHMSHDEAREKTVTFHAHKPHIKSGLAALAVVAVLWFLWYFLKPYIRHLKRRRVKVEKRNTEKEGLTQIRGNRGGGAGTGMFTE